MDSNLSARDWADRACKKRKGDVYFDKTQLPLMDLCLSKAIV